MTAEQMLLGKTAKAFASLTNQPQEPNPLRTPRCAMICPYCKAENATSSVTPGITSSTLMAGSPGHYNEQGAWVEGYDPNWHTTGYSCSRGHRWSVRRRLGEEDVVKHESTLTTTTHDDTSTGFDFGSIASLADTASSFDTPPIPDAPDTSSFDFGGGGGFDGGGGGDSF